MEPLPRDARLVRRAYWLIRIRWIAIIGVILATAVAHDWMHIEVCAVPLYCIAGALTIYNTVFLILLNRAVKPDGERLYRSVHTIVSTQISLDLIFLTVLLHYSGGIENPFMVYFVFHMAIASILLPVWESYLQAALAVCLIVLLVILEYRVKNFFPHHCLKGLEVGDFYHNGRHITIAVAVLSTTLFMIVYMTGSISTQLRGQEEAYWEANIELKEKDQVKDEYVARVTHDIKGHLAAIQSCLEVVSNGTLGELNERQSEFVGRAQNRTQTLSAFVRTLLRLTQMRLSRRLEMEEFSLRETVENTVEAVRAKARSKSISLTCDVEGGVDKMVGNRFSIEEMLMNLLFNSIKYTNENGWLKVIATSREGEYEIEITDSGIGIPSEDVEHVFDEFFRASNARKVERDGTGLGLSIVKQIVERHGGRIWVESQLGEGATFRFVLPRHGGLA